MTTGYSGPSVAVIQEISEDELEYLRSQGEPSANEKVHRIPRPSQVIVMPSPKANISKEREKERDRERVKERSRKYHKSTPSGSSHRHSHRNKTKNASTKWASLLSSGAREQEHEGRSRHRRSYPSHNRSSSSSSSSSSASEGDEPTKANSNSLLSARARLTSPSTISNLTSLTNTTHNSSSSSGSNSTVTQASVTKPLSPKKVEFPEAPMSPAVPDPPNVFAYLDSTESVVGHDGEYYEGTSNWSHLQNASVESALSPHILRCQASSSSSASSSHHSDDNASEAHHDVDHDVDTDRTTPEGSIGDQDEVQHQEDDEESQLEVEESPSHGDDASTKIASQLAAAQQRQNYRGQRQSFGTPDMQRGSANLQHRHPQALSTRQIKRRPLPRAEKLPVSGYELLASQLSSRPIVSDTENRERIKPIYRKFEALNHRVLLHLQDELSELEEQLHRLDLSDTQSRRTERDIVPASRRSAAAAGGELQWHKTDVLGKIGFKLAQYNQALSSFNSTRSLTAPQPEDVDAYRSYLDTAHPITESETRFLDPEDDLVSIYSDHVPLSTRSYTLSRNSSSLSYPPSTSAAESKSGDVDSQIETDDSQSIIQALAAALAVSILVPILTFSVIPGFVGRITATSLVVGGALAVLMQGGYITQSMLLKSEGLICSGIYSVVMIVIAGIMPA